LGYQLALEASNDELERSKGSLLKEKGRMEALLLRHHDLILCLEGGKSQGDRLSSSATGSDSTPSSLLNPDSGPMKERSRITKLANQLMNQATSEIQLIYYLGSGSYGKVYKGIWQGQLVAVKSVILPSRMTQLEKRITMAMMEVAVSAKLSHPSIVQTFTYRLRPLDGKQALANYGIISQAKAFHSDGANDVNKGDGQGTMAVPSGIVLGGAAAATMMEDSSLYTSSASSSPVIPRALSGMSEQYPSQTPGEAPPQGYSPAPSVSPSIARPVVAYEVLLVLELMEGGNMWEALRRGLTKKHDGSVDRKTVLTILANVAAGLLHLHANDLCHSDVKAENVMLKGGGGPVVAKLGDFG
jgi:serine/threonine protein kinase